MIGYHPKYKEHVGISELIKHGIKRCKEVLICKKYRTIIYRL